MDATTRQGNEPDALPVGREVPGWTARELPPRTPMAGRYARLEPLDPARHADSLWQANAADADGARWTYLFEEKPATLEAYRALLARQASTADPLFHGILDAATGRALGVAAFMRIDRNHGVIEIGHLNFSPEMNRTRIATEAIYLLASRAFDELGYRRLEWKCDSLNAPSRAAAERFGFTFEGIFRQAIVYKGRNRDTAWYSIIDPEWPRLRDAFRRWLDPANFDGEGRQRQRLSALTRPGGASGPGPSGGSPRA
jgi:RimJ/RimL family protein N-acetyltransferase